MNQRLGILFCLALVALSANQVMAQKQTSPSQPSATAPGQPESSAPQKQRSMREIVMMPVVYRVPGMDRVTVKSDLKYTAVNNPFLLMDMYSPPGVAEGERRPTKGKKSVTKGEKSEAKVTRRARGGLPSSSFMAVRGQRPGRKIGAFINRGDG